MGFYETQHSHVFVAIIDTEDYIGTLVEFLDCVRVRALRTKISANKGFCSCMSSCKTSGTTSTYGLTTTVPRPSVLILLIVIDLTSLKPDCHKIVP